MDFIEKNLMKLSDGVCSIANEILEPLTEFIPKRVKSSKTVSSNLRIELNGLIKCLASTVIDFPNSGSYKFHSIIFGYDFAEYPVHTMCEAE